MTLFVISVGTLIAVCSRVAFLKLNIFYLSSVLDWLSIVRRQQFFHGKCQNDVKCSEYLMKFLLR